MDPRLFTSADFTQLDIQPDPQKVAELAVLKAKKTAEMCEKYPDIMGRVFAGKVVYMLRGESPDEVLEAGGFRVRNPDFLWLSNTGNGTNMGAICFSLLPEVAAIFGAHTSNEAAKPWLYALSLEGNFLLPGGNWRQVISPGAFPIPSFWRARQIEEIAPNRQIKLGKMVGQGTHTGHIFQGENFDKYVKNQLLMPDELNYGEDSPLEYVIIDTDHTREFQQMITAHYIEKNAAKTPSF